MYCCQCGESASAFCTNPLTYTQRAATSCSASPVFNMLFMSHSPKWVYDNSILQRKVVQRKHKKEWQRVCYSWEHHQVKAQQWSPRCNWHLWNDEKQHTLLLWFSLSSLQSNFLRMPSVQTCLALISTYDYTVGTADKFCCWWCWWWMLDSTAAMTRM